MDTTFINLSHMTEYTPGDIQNTLGCWDVLQGWAVVLRSDRQAAELGSHSQRALLPWLAEQQRELGLQTEPGGGRNSVLGHDLEQGCLLKKSAYLQRKH